MSQLPTLVVLLSGNGSNLQAILEACAAGELPARVAAVISNKPEAFGLERARRANIPAIAKPKPAAQPRRDYDAELAGLVATYQPDWVVLAGWMRILSAAFLDPFANRVVNLHPALPGAYPGTHAIERAFEAFRRGEAHHTGVMVHLVPDEGVDSGPVLAQAVVPIEPDDTLDTLEARVHATEHRLLVSTLRQLCQQTLQQTCLCLVEPLQFNHYAEVRFIGVDETFGRFGEVTLKQCRHCGQHWLHYFVEYEHLKGSGRWYLGLITPEQAQTLQPQEAVAYLEKLEWCFHGGSYFEGRVGKSRGHIYVD